MDVSGDAGAVRSQERLLDGAYLPFVVAAVALVTMGAFENRAVTTVLPTVAEHLDGLAWFGAATAAPVATYVLGTTLSGAWADRRGPRGPLLAGLAAFALAQAIAGLAPHMAVFTGARLVGGAAEGALDISVTVLIASVLPVSLRPRMFAAVAAAWVLPSVVGPGIAGGLAEAFGWRSVFVAPLPFLVVAAVAIVPSLRRARAAQPSGVAADLPEAGARLAVRAVLLAASLAAVSVTGPLFQHPDGRALGTVALVGAAVVALWVGAGILPRGAYAMRRGIPALVSLNGLLGAAFGLAGAFVPLMLTTVYDIRPVWAGASLSVTGVFWAVGSWLQSLWWVQRRTTAAGRLRLGFMLVAVGSQGPVLIALGAVSIVSGLAMFTVAAAGIGLASPTIATQSLALAADDEQGRVAAGRQLSAAMAEAVGFAGAGAFLAAAGTDLTGPVFAGVGVAASAIAVVAAVTSGRVRTP